MAIRADRLRALRERAGLTQAELAARSGVPMRTIQRYETGKRAGAVEFVAKLAAALNTSTDFLAGVTSEHNPTIRRDDLSDYEEAVIIALRNQDVLEVIKLLASIENASDSRTSRPEKAVTFDDDEPPGNATTRYWQRGRMDKAAAKKQARRLKVVRLVES